VEITVTFRHVDSTPALRAYAEDKLHRVVKKYLHRPGNAHVILEVAKDRHSAEITLQADHESLSAKEVTHDLYSAIDLAIDKLEHQARKLKERRREHKGPGVRGMDREVTSRVLEKANGGSPAIVRTDRVAAKPMSVGEAVRQLAVSHDDFVVFIDADTEVLAVLYRRKDGNYGLIEPDER
jgi:putative sigma-54 modulation protein